ncbi:MAG TPA: sulfatase [Candidatus Hydrogenedentes bacterium]|nr:sulfatase [Candidatus Hydrogenedentota bacterium]HOL75692.1 sulfatase [Candidatus Hydrogenedentota bacterium]HPO84315.1 sulfatase [Candidatus Hydrogenedentota bacterium]
MRILYLDCDTLRPDHLSCYGYPRDTSPNIDEIASQGVRFTNYYASDAPCLPSRCALMHSLFGILTGVVGHGGTAADLRLEGASRGFASSLARAPWVKRLQDAGYYTVTVSPFAERHGAWWFYNGFCEMINTGKRGHERADEVAPYALDWLERNARKDNWFLHVNFWDPHTPYRTPVEYGNPFEDVSPPSWHTDEILEKNRQHYGAHSALDTVGFPWEVSERIKREGRIPLEIKSQTDYKRWIDGYDTGIHYMDYYIGQILETLDRQGVLDDTAIIVSSDHGENQGELNVYGDHQTADYITNRVPLIIRWPGVTPGGVVQDALLYNIDFAPTLMELVGGEASREWEGISFLDAIRGEPFEGREYLVVSQCAWTCQRAVRWRDYICIRTYHEGLRDYPPVMLFDVSMDPHETNDLASSMPHIVNEGLALLEKWTAEKMLHSRYKEDPLWTVIREGGPFHTRGCAERYCQYLRENGRELHARDIEIRSSARNDGRQ